MTSNPSNLNRVMPAEEIEILSALRPSVADLGEALRHLRRRQPRVHCLTNIVAAPFTANVLLALGAVPSMTVSPEEIGAFVASSDALLVNLGTFDRERREAVGIAVDTARETGKPWVLDPVFIDRSADRGRFAQGLLAKSPRIIRLNGSEYGALFDEPAQADLIQARALAGGVTIAVSGASDCVSDGRTPVICGNGHPFLQKVTAIGCAEAALMAAFATVTREPILAAIAGHIVMGVAGEIAAQKAQGPGSFSVHLIDALHVMDDALLGERARLS